MAQKGHFATPPPSQQLFTQHLLTKHQLLVLGAGGRGGGGQGWVLGRSININTDQMWSLVTESFHVVAKVLVSCVAFRFRQGITL
jgi:hypothetical protein